MKGYVYILTAPELPGVKIGFTTRTVAERIVELDKEFGSKFSEYAKYYVDNPDCVEKCIHKLFDTIGGRKRVREFFCIPPDEAFEVFRQVAALRGDIRNLCLCSEPSMQQRMIQEMCDYIDSAVKRIETAAEMKVAKE